MALMCTTRRRIAASARTNQGCEKGDLVRLRRRRGTRTTRSRTQEDPISPQKEQIVSLRSQSCTECSRNPTIPVEIDGSEEGDLVQFRRRLGTRTTRSRTARRLRHKKPCALNFEPYTLNPEYSTLNPKP